MRLFQLLAAEKKARQESVELKEQIKKLQVRHGGGDV